MYMTTKKLKEKIIDTMDTYKDILKECINENDVEWIELYISALKDFKSELLIIEMLELKYNYYEHMNDFDNLGIIAKMIVENKVRIINEYNFID